jgi:hypothetical protein
MSAEEFISQIHDENKEDIEKVIELLKVLEGLKKEEKEVYEFSVTSNL